MNMKKKNYFILLYRISDDDDQNSLTSYQKFDKNKIHQKVIIRLAN
jgi:hypothetical protein